MSDNTSVDITRLEGLIEDLAKSLQTPAEPAAADEAVEVIAKGADAIVEQNAQLLASFEKSMESLTARLDDMAARLDAALASNDEVKKSLADIAAEPQPKAVTAAPEVAPLEAAPAPTALTKSMVMDRAIAELGQAPNGVRRAELSKGISRLEANFSPADVAAELSYTF